jgi:DNA-binding NarL/FixJ family response regulator
MSIKLAIGCCNNLLGEALKKLIAGEKEIHIVGVFTTVAGLCEVAKTNVDLFLLCMHIFQSLSKEFSLGPRAKILLLADTSPNSSLPQWFEDLIGRGVAGILPCGADLNTLRKAVKSVFAGEFWLDRKVVGQILCHAAAGRKEKEKLTGAERGVASLICLGYRNKEIAQKLNITEQTVKSHCNHIYKKVEVPDRLRLAIKLGRNQNP